MSGIYIASISGRRQLWFCPIATNSHNWIPYSGKRLASWILAPAPVVVPTTGAQSSSLVLWPHSPTLIASIQKISKKEGNLPCPFTSPSLSLSLPMSWAGGAHECRGIPTFSNFRTMRGVHLSVVHSL